MSKEIPILFITEMVRAILDGRKTQTRRPVKLPPGNWKCDTVLIDGTAVMNRDNGYEIKKVKSPFGKPGDVLWVRETALFWRNYLGRTNQVAAYKADGYKLEEGEAWTPSIHMPKEACRIKLLVKRVWVERVQDTGIKDAIKEGCKCDCMKPDYCPGSIFRFFELWDSIYKNWSENPWVWCCEFEVIR